MLYSQTMSCILVLLNVSKAEEKERRLASTIESMQASHMLPNTNLRSRFGQSASVTKKSETIAYFATPVLNPPRLIDFCRQTKRNWRNYLKRPNKRSGSLGHDQETCGVQPELTVFIHPDPLNVQTCKCYMQIMSERVNTDDVVAWNLNDVQSWHVLAREGSLLQAEAKEIERADAVKAAQAVSLGVNIARCCTRFVWIFGNIFVHDLLDSLTAGYFSLTIYASLCTGNLVKQIFQRCPASQHALSIRKLRSSWLSIDFVWWILLWLTAFPKSRQIAELFCW